jgi:hypothetical protein
MLMIYPKSIKNSNHTIPYYRKHEMTHSTGMAGDDHLRQIKFRGLDTG